MDDSRNDTMARLYKVLLETEDDAERATAHIRLARLAQAGRRVDLAIRHFQEALLLDAELEEAREALEDLGAPFEPSSAADPVPSRLTRLLDRWRS